MKISCASSRENATFGRSWSASDLDQKSERIFPKYTEYFIYVVVNSVFSLTISMIIKYLLTETSGNSVFC